MTMAVMVMNSEASTVEAVIMNMMIICSLAAWWTEDPPRIAPVIIPGIAMIPIVLQKLPGNQTFMQKYDEGTYLMMLIGFVSASFRA